MGIEKGCLSVDSSDDLAVVHRYRRSCQPLLLSSLREYSTCAVTAGVLPVVLALPRLDLVGGKDRGHDVMLVGFSISQPPVKRTGFSCPTWHVSQSYLVFCADGGCAFTFFVLYVQRTFALPLGLAALSICARSAPFDRGFFGHCPHPWSLPSSPPPRCVIMKS